MLIPAILIAKRQTRWLATEGLMNCQARYQSG